MLDEYVLGSAYRLSPEAPVPVLQIKQYTFALGGAGNVALNLAKLGVKVSIVGVHGQDNAGQSLQKLTNEAGINNLMISSGNYPTITKTRFIAEKHQLMRADREEIFSPDIHTEKRILDILLNGNFDSIVISDYGKGLCNEAICQAAIEFAKVHNLPVFVDPKGNQWQKYRGAFLVTPNFKEFEEIVGEKLSNTDEIINQHATNIIDYYNLNFLLVTRSERGMSLTSKEQNTIHFSAKSQEVYDVTGAGDTVISVITAYYTRHNNLPNACEIANIAAGYVVQKFGAYAISISELNDLANSLTYQQ